MSSSKSRVMISEDWVVVILGLAIIFLALFGVIIPKQSFSWDSTDVLFSLILAVEKLQILGGQSVLVIDAALLRPVLLGKPLKPSLFVFPIIFVWSIFALILAGNSSIRDYIPDAVIFSLGIGLLI